MNKDGSITIDSNDFIKGISDSRYTGIEHMRNLDPFTKIGLLRISYKLDAESNAPSTALLKFSAINPRTGDIFFAPDESSDSIYKRTGSNSWTTISGATSGTARGLVIGNDYLFRVRNSGGNTIVDRYGPLSSSPSWSNSWGTLRTSDTATYVPSIYGQDGIIYFGINNDVASISDVTSAGSINSSALDIPDGYVIQSFTELGINLMVGASMGDSVSSIGDIFPWDRTSSSFSLPIQTGLQGIPMMYTKNNLIYAIGGRFGQMFVTNSSSVEQRIKLSNYTMNPEVRFVTNEDAIDAHNSGLIIGLSKTAGTENGPAGVWVVNDNTVTLQTLSIGDSNDSDGCEIGCVVSLSDFSYLVTWKDNTGSDTYGVDVVDTGRRVSSYGAYLDSRMYQVGTKLSPKTFQKLLIKFASPLASSQGIKVSYRLNSSDSYTEIETFAYGSGTGADNDNLGGIMSIDFSPLNIPATESIQFRIALTTNTSNDATPELEYLIIK